MGKLFFSFLLSVLLLQFAACENKGNSAPVAAFIYNPASGDAPLAVSFDASGSHDSDGATAEIAEKIGQVLRQAGLRTDVLPANRVSDPTQYTAVILGSAVYIGRWRKEAAKFLKTNEKALAEQPLWLFSSGPTGKGDPVKLTEGWRFPKNLQSIAKNIKPRDIKLFHGNVDTKKLNFIQKFMIKKVEAPVGDFRDWNAITSWATAIADVLKEKVSASGTQSE